MKYINYQIDKNIKAITTLKEMGNMAFQVDKSNNDVDKRRLDLSTIFNTLITNFTFVHQTHSDIIIEVTPNNKGRGLYSFEDGIKADALYTKEPNIPIGVFHADCVPIFLYDPTIPLIGIIHAGFQGTLKHITYKAITTLKSKEKINTSNLMVYIGPYRHLESFQINEKEREEIMISGCPLFSNHFDMKNANVLDMICAGVLPNNIHDINIDTTKDERCFSAFLKEPIGRMTSIIMMK